MSYGDAIARDSASDCNYSWLRNLVLEVDVHEYSMCGLFYKGMQPKQRRL